MQQPNVEQIKQEIALLSEMAIASLDMAKAFTEYKTAENKLIEQQKSS